MTDKYHTTYDPIRKIRVVREWRTLSHWGMFELPPEGQRKT